MQVFVRTKNTGEYLGESFEWFKEISRARNFRTSVLALNFCRQHCIFDAEIVLSFGEARFDVILPAFTEQEGRDFGRDPPTSRADSA